MSLVALSGTDLAISRIGFGTASLHHRFRQRDRIDLLKRAVSLGLSHIDTAPYYGDGLAECDIGALPTSMRSRITVTTKVGLYPRWGCSHTALSLRVRRLAVKLAMVSTSPISDLDIVRSTASLNRSLTRLRLDCIDLLLLHEPQWTNIDHDAILDWLTQCRAAGKIRAWGVAGARAAVERTVSMTLRHIGS
jgi:aryl-alcohol dehydrogenase-like predicted oxidoreductase